MTDVLEYPGATRQKSWIDRALRPFGEVRPGEGITTLLMLVNIFLILVCYSVIKIVREPLILLGGGAEMRSYAAAGQALLLMGFVPFFSWFASRVDRLKLLVGVTVFFIVNIQLFALAVAANVPYVGILFFVWVGIFSISLIAQFWSYANDICTKEAGDRLFPIITIGMTAGAPLGSVVAGRLFGAGVEPQLILQVSAALLFASLILYLLVNRREARRTPTPKPVLAAGNGFQLVFNSRYLQLIAVLIVLLNVVNTTGEYLIANLVSARADALGASNPGFDKGTFIGAYYGDYQFWVNVVALVLQAFVTSRLVKYQGVRGALLALPFIALGGYAIIAAGVGFAVVRWVKTAENATDYSIMNTARQLLWLPTTREEKYKAKQAIDTFFMRGGDLLSAGFVFVGTSVVQLTVAGFATVNVLLTLVWLAVAFAILKQHRDLTQQSAKAA
jgi:AAA family ATP:ADP antiporter